MKPFGAWFNEQRNDPAKEIDARVWMECRGCGRSESVSVAAYENGDTGWYVEEQVEPNGAYRGVCGGSHLCTP
jgi:hypothetical protein